MAKRRDLLDLVPGPITIETARDQDDVFWCSRQQNGTTLTLTGWSSPTAEVFDGKGGDSLGTFTASIDADRVKVVMTKAEKASLPSVCFWVVKITDPDTLDTKLAEGPLKVEG